MKKVILAMLLFSTMHVSANEEFSMNVNMAGHDISISKIYVGEPVSKRRRLIVSQKCGSEKREIYNDKYCDFSKFVLNEQSLSFVAKLYNPDTGECTSPNTKSVNLKIENNCK